MEYRSGLPAIGRSAPANRPGAEYQGKQAYRVDFQVLVDGGEVGYIHAFEVTLWCLSQA